jgi:hypothetical protein
MTKYSYIIPLRGKAEIRISHEVAAIADMEASAYLWTHVNAEAPEVRERVRSHLLKNDLEAAIFTYNLENADLPIRKS